MLTGKSTLILASVAVILGAQSALCIDDGWQAIGFDRDRLPRAWIQLKSRSDVNADSFSVPFRSYLDNGQQFTGELQINCRNKDFSVNYPAGLFTRNNGWNSIGPGTPWYTAAQLLCRTTQSRAEWGYLDSNKILWDQPAPKGDPGALTGEWIQVNDNDEIETYYNDQIIKGKGFIQVAIWGRQKKGDRSAAMASDNAAYSWINVSCDSNSYSSFVKIDTPEGGIWSAPVPGRPNGAAIAVRKRFCDSASTR